MMNAKYKRIVGDIKACELCGSHRSLDVHHIVPRVFGGEDEADNLVVVCQKCHGILTPRGVLTKAGIRTTKERNMLATFALKFLRTVDEQAGDGLSGADILDIFNSTFRKQMEA